jgi:hypothetical protein
VALNKIELFYDRPVNLQTATKANSYWVRNNTNQATDIASISKNDPVAINNALTPNRVKITPIDNTRTRFLMIFNVNATSGVQYTVIPCFITTPDRSGYMGGNYSPSSKNTFIAR